MRQVAALCKLAAFLAFTIPLMPVQWMLLALRLPLANRLPHNYHAILCKILGVEINLVGQEKLTGIVVANHVSWLDIPILSAVTPLSFVAKSEVALWPLFGRLAKLQRSVFVERQSRISTSIAQHDMLGRIAKRETIVLFPEGTSHNGKSVREFKSPFFATAIQSGVPIIPVCLVYHAQHGLPLTARQRPSIAWYGNMDLLPHLWNYLKAGPCSVRVLIGQPLLPSEFPSRKALAAATQNVIAEMLAQELQKNQ